MSRPSRAQVAGGVLTGAVVAAVVAGVLMLPPPADERARRLDERRVQDLRAVAGAVDLYWTRHARLPPALDDLSREPGLDARSSDPDTGVRYEYRALEGGTYEVCATFERDSEEPGAERFWAHRAGRQCFRREARKVR